MDFLDKNFLPVFLAVFGARCYRFTPL